MKIGLRVVATFTLFCFITTQCISAFPGAKIEMAGSREIPFYQSIVVPEELGTVDSLYEAPAGANPQFILHIQNAHANYQAQMKIKQLLGYMNRKYGFKTIFVEGASEELDADYLRLFPDAERNLKLCDELAKQGELTGAELFLMEQSAEGMHGSGDAVQALGIEKASLYKANYNVLKKIFGAEADVALFFKGFDRKLDQVASRTFAPEVRELIADWKRFEQGRREFMPFVKSLVAKSKKILKIDLESLFAQVGWPQITRLLVIQTMERDLNKTKGVAEQAALLKMLRRAAVSQELLTALTNFKEGSIVVGKSATEVSPREVLERLASEAGPKGFQFSDYPAFSLYAGYLTLRSELDSKILFEEIEYLFTQMLDALVQESEQKALLTLYRDGELLRKLLSLELNRAQWQQVLKAKDRMTIPSLVARLKAAVEKVDDGGRKTEGVKAGSVPSTILHPISPTDVMPPKFGKTMDGLFTAGLEFYDYAHKREAVFYEEMQAAMTERKVNKAILITGGFHTDGMSDLFRENAVSYGIVTPRLSEKSNENLYRTNMLQNREYLFSISNLEMAAKLMPLIAQHAQGVDIDAVFAVILNAMMKAGAENIDAVVLLFNQSDLAKMNRITLVRAGNDPKGKPIFRVVTRTPEDAAELSIPIEDLNVTVGPITPPVKAGAVSTTATRRSEVRLSSIVGCFLQEIWDWLEQFRGELEQRQRKPEQIETYVAKGVDLAAMNERLKAAGLPQNAIELIAALMRKDAGQQANGLMTPLEEIANAIIPQIADFQGIKADKSEKVEILKTNIRLAIRNSALGGSFLSRSIRNVRKKAGIPVSVNKDYVLVDAATSSDSIYFMYHRHGDAAIRFSRVPLNSVDNGFRRFFKFFRAIISSDIKPGEDIGFEQLPQDVIQLFGLSRFVTNEIFKEIDLLLKATGSEKIIKIQRLEKNGQTIYFVKTNKGIFRLVVTREDNEGVTTETVTNSAGGRWSIRSDHPGVEVVEESRGMLVPEPYLMSDTYLDTSWTSRELLEMAKKIVEGIISKNDYAADIQKALRGLVEAIVNNEPIEPLPADTRGGDAPYWNEVILKDIFRDSQTWKGDVPHNLVIAYFFRLILEKVQYWESKKDPFVLMKQKALHEFLISPEGLSNLMTGFEEKRPVDRLPFLLDVGLWSNNYDPSNPIDPDAEKNYLIDHRTAIVEKLQSRSVKTLEMDTDNAGPEIVSDLWLAQYLLDSNLVERVILNVKNYPLFISDATQEDVEATLEQLKASPDGKVSQLGNRLKALKQQGKLIVSADPFSTSGMTYDQKPENLRKRSDLIFVNGDWNYRLVTGNRRWGIDQKMNRVVRNDVPVVIRRTVKSDTVIGADPTVVASLAAKDPDWFRKGRGGMIVLVEPEKTEKSPLRSETRSSAIVEAESIITRIRYVKSDGSEIHYALDPGTLAAVDELLKNRGEPDLVAKNAWILAKLALLYEHLKPEERETKIVQWIEAWREAQSAQGEGGEIPAQDKIPGSSWSTFFDFMAPSFQKDPVRPFRTLSVVSYLRYAVAQGIRNIEIPLDFLPFDPSTRLGGEFSAAEIKAIRHFCETHDLTLTVHSPIVGPLNSKTGFKQLFEEPLDNLNLMKEQIVVAGKMGARQMVVHFASLDRAEEYAELVTYAFQNAPGLKISFENYFNKQKVFPTSDEFMNAYERMLAKVAEMQPNAISSVGMVIDTAHYNLTGKEDPVVAVYRIAKRVEGLANRYSVAPNELLSELHMNQNLGPIKFFTGFSADLHSPVTMRGPIHNQAIIIMLQLMGYSPLLTLEQMSAPSRADIELLRAAPRLERDFEARGRASLEELSEYRPLFIENIEAYTLMADILGTEQMREHFKRRIFQSILAVNSAEDFESLRGRGIIPAGVSFRTFEPGTQIVRQGDLIGSSGSAAGKGAFYLLVQSAAAGVVQGTAESMRRLFVVPPGRFFGERAVLTMEPRNATVTASEKVFAVEFSIDAIHEFMEVMPDLRVLMEVVNRSREMENYSAFSSRSELRKTMSSVQSAGDVENHLLAAIGVMAGNWENGLARDLVFETLEDPKQSLKLRLIAAIGIMANPGRWRVAVARDLVFKTLEDSNQPLENRLLAAAGVMAGNWKNVLARDLVFKTLAAVRSEARVLTRRGFLKVMGAAGLVAAAADLIAAWGTDVEESILDAGDWKVLGASDSGPAASSVQTPRGNFTELKILYKGDQVFSVKGNGYLRGVLPSSYRGPKGERVDWGTSFVLPGYWSGGVYHHNPRITRAEFGSLSDGTIVMRGAMEDEKGAFQATEFKLIFRKPSAERVEMEVRYTLQAKKNISLDADRVANHEGFKVFSFSSMNINRAHDADFFVYQAPGGKVRVPVAGADRLILQNPQPLSNGVVYLANESPSSGRYRPTTFIQILPGSSSGNYIPQGWVARSDNPDDDNVGVWLSDDQTKTSYRAGETITTVHAVLGVTRPGPSFVAPTSEGKMGSVGYSVVVPDQNALMNLRWAQENIKMMNISVASDGWITMAYALSGPWAGTKVPIRPGGTLAVEIEGAGGRLEFKPDDKGQMDLGNGKHVLAVPNGISSVTIGFISGKIARTGTVRVRISQARSEVRGDVTKAGQLKAQVEKLLNLGDRNAMAGVVKALESYIKEMPDSMGLSRFVYDILTLIFKFHNASTTDFARMDVAYDFAHKLNTGISDIKASSGDMILIDYMFRNKDIKQNQEWGDFATDAGWGETVAGNVVSDMISQARRSEVRQENAAVQVNASELDHALNGIAQRAEIRNQPGIVIEAQAWRSELRKMVNGQFDPKVISPMKDFIARSESRGPELTPRVDVAVLERFSKSLSTLTLSDNIAIKMIRGWVNEPEGKYVNPFLISPLRKYFQDRKPDKQALAAIQSIVNSPNSSNALLRYLFLTAEEEGKIDSLGGLKRSEVRSMPAVQAAEGVRALAKQLRGQLTALTNVQEKPTVKANGATLEFTMPRGYGVVVVSNVIGVKIIDNNLVIEHWDSLADKQRTDRVPFMLPYKVPSGQPSIMLNAYMTQAKQLAQGKSFVELRQELASAVEAELDPVVLSKLKTQLLRFEARTFADVVAGILVPAEGVLSSVEEIAASLKTLVAFKTGELDWGKFLEAAKSILNNPVLAVSDVAGATIIVLKEAPTDVELQDMNLQLSTNTGQVVHYVVASPGRQQETSLRKKIEEIQHAVDYKGEPVGDKRIKIHFAPVSKLGSKAKTLASTLSRTGTPFEGGSNMTLLVPEGMTSQFDLIRGGTIMESRKDDPKNSSARNLLAMKTAQISKTTADPSVAALLNRQIGDTVIILIAQYFGVEGDKLGALAKFWAELLSIKATSVAA